MACIQQQAQVVPQNCQANAKINASFCHFCDSMAEESQKMDWNLSDLLVWSNVLQCNALQTHQCLCCSLNLWRMSGIWLSKVFDQF